MRFSLATTDDRLRVAAAAAVVAKADLYFTCARAYQNYAEHACIVQNQGAATGQRPLRSSWRLSAQAKTLSLTAPLRFLQVRNAPKSPKDVSTILQGEHCGPRP